MASIGDFLAKFKQFDSERNATREEIVAVVKRVAGIELKVEQVSLKNGVLILQVPPIVKSELFMKREQLLEALKNRKVTQIR